MEEYYWVAIYTKSRAEKKLAVEFDRLEIEHYLPIVKTKVQWTDRKKVVEKVLIPGYIFAKISEKEYYDVLNLYGAVAYVRTEGKAARIRESQIDSMKLLLQDECLAKLEPTQLKRGQAVEITYGSFKGFQGEILSVKSARKLIVRIEQLGFCISLEVPASHVEPSNS